MRRVVTNRHATGDTRHAAQTARCRHVKYARLSQQLMLALTNQINYTPLTKTRNSAIGTGKNAVSQAKILLQFSPRQFSSMYIKNDLKNDGTKDISS